MKRFFSIVLATALVFAMVTPALATDGDFYDGYYDGYSKGMEEGAAKGEAEQGGPYTASYDPRVDEEPYIYDSKWEKLTYEEGYKIGYDWYYGVSYYEAWSESYYTAGYADGETKAAQDYAAGTKGKNGPRYADLQEAASIPDYAYGEGYYYGYTGKIYDLAYDEMYQVGWADYEAGKPEAELPYPSSGCSETAEEDYKLGQYYGYYSGYADAVEAYWKDEAITEMGGVPAQINVMLNDKMVAFPDARPEFLNDRTMVPVRAIMEATGATVELLEGDIVQITLGETVMKLPIGSDTLTVTKGTETKEIKLDAPAYEKNDRTYVPLRFVTEALGYEVYWDEDFNTAVLLDKASIVAKLNEGFSVYNGYLKAQSQIFEKPKQVSSTFSLKVEALDSIDGNQTHIIDGYADMYLSKTGMSLTANLNLTALEPMAKKLLGSSYEYAEEWISEVAKNHKIKMIVNPEGEGYLYFPLLDKYLSDGTVKTSAERWYSLGEIDLEKALSPTTLGENIYDMCVADTWYTYPVFFYEDMFSIRESCGKLLGDGSFKKSGSEYRWKLDKDRLLSILGDDEEGYVKEMLDTTFEIFEFDLTLGQEGQADLLGKIKTFADYYMPKLKMELDSKSSSSGSQVEALLQIQNMYNIFFSEKTDIRNATSTPSFELPNGAKVVTKLEKLEDKVPQLLGYYGYQYLN